MSPYTKFIQRLADNLFKKAKMIQMNKQKVLSRKRQKRGQPSWSTP